MLACLREPVLRREEFRGASVEVEISRIEHGSSFLLRSLDMSPLMATFALVPSSFCLVALASDLSADDQARASWAEYAQNAMAKAGRDGLSWTNLRVEVCIARK